MVRPLILLALAACAPSGPPTAEDLAALAGDASFSCGCATQTAVDAGDTLRVDLTAAVRGGGRFTGDGDVWVRTATVGPGKELQVRILVGRNVSDPGPPCAVVTDAAPYRSPLRAWDVLLGTATITVAHDGEGFTQSVVVDDVLLGPGERGFRVRPYLVGRPNPVELDRLELPEAAVLEEDGCPILEVAEDTGG